MKIVFRIAVLSIACTAAAQAAAVDPEVFKARRETLMEMLDGRVAVLYGAPHATGGVVEELFIQESSFYYLTGISEPGAAMILAPDENQYKEILYLQPRDPDVENWNGRRAPLGDALEKATGFPEVRRIGRLGGDLTDIMQRGRKAAFLAMGRISPDYYCIDGTIPRRQLSQVLEAITQLSATFGLRVANVFHAGDGNLHPLILYDTNVPGELDKAEAMGGKILELCVEAGGSVTGEHGVGVEKLDQMCVQFNEAELRQFERVKEAFDPERLLNPGKAIPTLTRCSELGGMHVHGGKLPFPKMERF